MQNRLSAAVGAPTCGYHYEPHRYVDMDDHSVAAELARFSGTLLMRGRLQTLLVRREIGGLLFEFARRNPRSRIMFERCAATTVGLSYDEARRHIQLWVAWPRCELTIERLQEEARRLGKPFVVPGLRRLLVLAGVVGRRGGLTFEMPPPPSHLVYRLPNTVAELRAIVRSLLSKQRVLRARIVVLEGQAAYANDKVRHLRGESAHLRRRIRQMPNPSADKGTDRRHQSA